jgi:hypothetical protein
VVSYAGCHCRVRGYGFFRLLCGRAKLENRMWGATASECAPASDAELNHGHPPGGGPPPENDP